MKWAPLLVPRTRSDIFLLFIRHFFFFIRHIRVWVCVCVCAALQNANLTDFFQMSYKSFFCNPLENFFDQNNPIVLFNIVWGGGAFPKKFGYVGSREDSLTFPFFLYNITNVYENVMAVCDFLAFLVLYVYKEKCVLPGYGMLVYVYFTFSLLDITVWSKNVLKLRKYVNSLYSRQRDVCDLVWRCHIFVKCYLNKFTDILRIFYQPC